MEPIGLDLDGSLGLQPQLRRRLKYVADFREMEQGLRLMSSREKVGEFERRILDLRRERAGPWLTFYGSGDFHYLTEVLLATLPSEVERFSVVHIDNHPDWFSNPPRYHCGNWVARALKMKRIESFHLIGQDSPDLMWFKTWTAPAAALASRRLTIYPKKIKKLLFPLRARPFKFETADARGAPAIFEATAKKLAGSSIYITVDKDVLAESFGASDWERGGMTVDELTNGIRILRENCRVIGADVCGEQAPGELKGFWKRFDSGRLFGRTGGGDASKNEPTNLAILQAFECI